MSHSTTQGIVTFFEMKRHLQNDQYDQTTASNVIRMKNLKGNVEFQEIIYSGIKKYYCGSLPYLGGYYGR